MRSDRTTPRRDRPCAAERLDNLEARAELVEAQLALVELALAGDEPEQGG
jgi:hypothetical protein